MAALREYLEVEEARRRSCTQIWLPLLKFYRDVVAYRDVVERHRVRDAVSLNLFISMAETSFAGVFSISAAYRGSRPRGLTRARKPLPIT